MRIAAALLALASAGAILTLSTETALAEEPRQLIIHYSSPKPAASKAASKRAGSLYLAARHLGEPAGGQRRHRPGCRSVREAGA